MASYVEDTIAAIATAIGPGAISILRLSGVDARRIAEAVLQSAGGEALPLDVSHRAQRGRLVRPSDGFVIDDVVALPMWAPRSYSGEDVVEIHCHGGRLIADLALRAVLAEGARAAHAGEFTERAYLNGKLDLCQAEAVADMISAGSEAGLEAAHRNLAGELSSAVGELRERLLDARALTEAHLDFPEEDLPPDVEADLLGLLSTAQSQVADLLASYERGRLLREGIRVVLVGRPNVGKSSLMNALLGRTRALVSDEAGTTRDYLEEPLALGNLQVLLCDTAGLRESADRIEQAGVEATLERASNADVVVFLVDASAPPSEEDETLFTSFPGKPLVAVRSKCDLPEAWPGPLPWCDTFLPVSSRKRMGLEALLAAIQSAAEQEEPAKPGPIVLSARHHEALSRAAAPLAAASDLIAAQGELELVSAELQTASTALQDIVGHAGIEDVLDRIFSRFCVGK